MPLYFVIQVFGEGDNEFLPIGPGLSLDEAIVRRSEELTKVEFFTDSGRLGIYFEIRDEDGNVVP
ncbi:MAG: hypothetical protein Q8L36_03335 [bacterium]|nr:hypothetical protein [bacterium]